MQTSLENKTDVQLLTLISVKSGNGQFLERKLYGANRGRVREKGGGGGTSFYRY